MHLAFCWNMPWFSFEKQIWIMKQSNHKTFKDVVYWLWCLLDTSPNNNDNDNDDININEEMK